MKRRKAKILYAVIKRQELKSAHFDEVLAKFAKKMYGGSVKKFVEAL